ncbi:hypothetical protein [Microbacterium sp. SLBN-154]|uniref:hypothetical protein n=1 Tax=Microbacterium sp. SLBN-154 TaxID=2768458 RepID=UPI00135960F0|nr:hypothetical protein [Microbacterium sp. SLBN-154]
MRIPLEQRLAQRRGKGGRDVWLDAEGVQRPAVEVPRRGGEGDVDDLAIAEPEPLQLSGILGRHGRRVPAQSLGEGHHRDLVGGESRRAVIAGDAFELVGIDVTERLHAVVGAARGRAQCTGRRQRDQLVPSHPEAGNDGADELLECGDGFGVQSGDPGVGRHIAESFAIVGVQPGGSVFDLALGGHADDGHAPRVRPAPRS